MFVCFVSLTLHYISRPNYLQFPPISPTFMNALSQQIKQSSEFKMSDSQQALLISKESSIQTLLDRSKTHLQSSVPREDMLRNDISVALDDFVAASNAEDTLTPSACEAENSKEKEERYLLHCPCLSHWYILLVFICIVCDRHENDIRFLRTFIIS